MNCHPHQNEEINLAVSCESLPIHIIEPLPLTCCETDNEENSKVKNHPEDNNKNDIVKMSENELDSDRENPIN